MFKYMKYEIKGTYKFMGLLILFVLGASTGIQLYANNIIKRFSNEFQSGLERIGNIPNFLVVLLVLMIFGAFITAFFYIIGLFRKELYEDRGYLTFSLPLTGNQILGAKMLIALMWAAVLGLSTLFYNLILGSILFKYKLLEGFKIIFSYLSASTVIILLFTYILSAVITLLLIYFSITISRVSIRSKKIGGLWFILFLVLNSFTTYLTVQAAKISPYYISLGNFNLLSSSDITSELTGQGFFVINTGTSTGLAFTSSGDILLNIGMIIFSILIAVGTFLGTSYLMERKIDI